MVDIDQHNIGKKNPDWQQYYPTHRFKNRDILISEYEASSKSIESLERLYLNAINILIIIAAVLVSLGVGLMRSPSSRVAELLSEQNVLLLMLLVAVFSSLTIKYFAERHKSIIFDSRKIVMLRRMLGLDYGDQQLVLPSWRLEGATNPFAIRMFPGWFSYVTYPFWLIFLSSTFILYALVVYFFRRIHIHDINEAVIGIIFIWSLLSFYIYRSSLFDTHENRRLVFAKFLAKLLNVKLVRNFEYIIYRARLAKYETRRNGVRLENLISILVFIEDRGFFQHSGISLRGSIRALLGVVGLKRKSGGSTITQQLARTLFIIDLSKTIRRKVLEYPLAMWLNQQIPKDELLEIYLSSVRFDSGIYGIIAAIKYFFPDELHKPISKAKAFFLIERISNVKSGVLLGKIRQTVDQLVKNQILEPEDVEELKKTYELMVKKRRVLLGNKTEFNKWIMKVKRSVNLSKRAAT